MDASSRPPWLRTAIVVGLAYSVIGIGFGLLAGWSASNQMRITWRMSAWVASAIAFAVHIGYEHFRLENAPLKVASHASAAVALGAFGLAVWANAHAQLTSSRSRPLAFYLLALVAWPALTAIPAFVVALLAAGGLALRRRSSLAL
jgi:hypothetical protein